MYIIQEPSLEILTCLLSVTNNYTPKEFQTKVKELYKKLYGKDIKIQKSRYPNTFVETLPFTDNVLKISKKELAKRFYKWAWIHMSGYSTYQYIKPLISTAYTKTRQTLSQKTAYFNKFVRPFYAFSQRIYLTKLTNAVYHRIHKYISFKSTYTPKQVTLIKDLNMDTKKLAQPDILQEETPKKEKK
jgi:hypothetical protein